MRVHAREEQKLTKSGGAWKNWYPTWRDIEGNVERKAVCPTGMMMNLMKVDRDAVIVVGRVIGKHRVDDPTWSALKSANLI